MAEHGVKFVELIDLVDNLRFSQTHFLSEGFHILFFLWQEFVEGWIEHSDGDWFSLHNFEEGSEVFFLELFELLEGSLSFSFVAGNNHLSDSEDSFLLEEHVLGSAKTNTFGTEINSSFSILWGISVSSDLELSDGISPDHDGPEVSGLEVWTLELDFSFVDISGVTVKSDVVAFLEDLSVLQLEILLLFVDFDDVLPTTDTGSAHTSADDGGM